MAFLQLFLESQTEPQMSMCCKKDVHPGLLLPCSSPLPGLPFSVLFSFCELDLEGFFGQSEHIWLMELP